MASLMSTMYSFVYVLYSTYHPSRGLTYLDCLSCSSINITGMKLKPEWHTLVLPLDQFWASLSYISVVIGSQKPWKRNMDGNQPRYPLQSASISFQYRLALFVWPQFLMPIGLLMYGWAAQYKTHWYYRCHHHLTPGLFP
jgi:hypothetical protein